MNSYQSIQEQDQTLLRYQTGIYPEDFISCVKSNNAEKGNLIKLMKFQKDGFDKCLWMKIENFLIRMKSRNSGLFKIL